MTQPMAGDDVSGKPRCVAEIMLMDDRWGAFTDRCEGDEDHDGDHFVVMGATMPLGRLVWPQERVHKHVVVRHSDGGLWCGGCNEYLGRNS